MIFMFWIGLLCCLVALGLKSKRDLHSLGAIGSTIIAAYALSIGCLEFFILNLCFIFVNLYSLYQIVKVKYDSHSVENWEQKNESNDTYYFY